MLKKHIEGELTKNLNYTPTESQKRLFASLADFIMNWGADEIFLLTGYAGTGKTTTIKTLVNTLYSFKINSILMAPTGRAAKVLGSYTYKPAYTIHKKIYRQKSAQDGFGDFALDKNLYKNTYFIVDEASMISNQSFEMSIFGSGRLLDDLIEYVYQGHSCKLILLGDTAQLPPVKMDLSPALDPSQLEGYGLNVKRAFLTDILRQSKESGILYNATLLRQMIEQETSDYPKFQVKEFPDIERTVGSEMVELISDAYDQHGIEETVIVTRSNKRANNFNQGIRNQILWREEELAIGDFLMVVKNNYFWIDEEEKLDFVANGDIVEVVDIKGYQSLYGYRFADLTLRFVDYDDLEIDAKVLMDTLYTNQASLSKEENQNLFQSVLEDYQDLKTKKARYKKVRENPYFNALQVKFAYAVTCHKAQGGQWKVVFVDHGYITGEMINKEFYRWLYTAFTRATEKLYLVNFHKSFFPDDEDVF
ncbi:MAG: AAA family ATPase [Bacteroidales bacterium]|nr:AAA family ATPase [Bacteroidales bacterium]MBS3774796.1 AAA family ATPase [Bacteroidales bacterium]